MKEKVINWIQEGCDFNAGLTLLSSFGKNKQLARALAGHEKRYAGKLLYELCKKAGFTLVEFQQIKKTLEEIVQKFEENPPADDAPAGNLPSADLDSDIPPAADHLAGDPLVDIPPSADPPAVDPPSDNIPAGVPPAIHMVPALPGQIPDDVEKVIMEHASLFKLRAQLHEQMSELPEENTEETVKKRKNLSDSIALISPRIDLMFAAKEAFYNEGKLPDMVVLFPEPKQDQPPVEELPNDSLELKKMKKNLQSANTKDMNLLDYQVEKKASKQNPMPLGPKRKKLEARIKERTETIEKIDYKLLSLAN